MEKRQENVNEASAPKSMKLHDRVRETLRLKQYSIRTKEACVDGIIRLILFPVKNTTVKIWYRPKLIQVLDISLEGQSSNALRVRKKKNLPIVLTKEKVERVIAFIPGKYQLMAKIMYGGGLRLMECIRLRGKDLDFEMNELSSHSAPGIGKARTAGTSGTCQALTRAAFGCGLRQRLSSPCTTEKALE